MSVLGSDQISVRVSKGVLVLGCDCWGVTMSVLRLVRVLLSGLELGLVRV